MLKYNLRHCYLSAETIEMKRTANLAVGLAAVLLMGAGKKDEEAGTNKQMIQGTWEYVSAVRDGKPYENPIGVRITFAGDKVTRIIGKETHEHGYKLDPKKDPKQVSLIRTSNGKTEVSTGIYRLKGDTLTWCFNLPGKPIPKTLATKPGDGLTLCVLKRVGPDSKTGCTHVITGDTEYYTTGPQQARPPDGTLAADTKVRLVEEAGSYSLVESQDGVRAYVANGTLKLIEEETEKGAASLGRPRRRLRSRLGHWIRCIRKTSR